MTDRTPTHDAHPLWLAVLTQPGTGTEEIRRFGMRTSGALWLIARMHELTGAERLPVDLRDSRVSVVSRGGWSAHLFRVTDPYAISTWRSALLDDGFEQ